MNFPYFISQRVVSSTKSNFASTISRLAVISISTGLCAMILSFFILGGFQKTIKNKIYDFKGHIEITKFTLGSSYDEQPISKNEHTISQIEEYDFTEHVQFFAHKAGMFKTKEEVEGVLFKGVSSNFGTERFSSNMVEGEFLKFPDSAYSKEVVVSRYLSKKLGLKVGDGVVIYFVQNPPRFRKLKIVGLYETGMEEIDRSLVIGDLGLIQRLNNWPDSLVGGYEIFLKNESMSELAEEILYSDLEADLYVQKVSDKFMQIFDWLELLDQNVLVFLVLILVVACFNMISILLILIMERTNMVGVLQSLGTNLTQIRKIFFYNGIQLVIKGMVWGNGIALSVAYLQDKFKIIPLDSVNYYMEYVPIEWNYKALLLINLLTFVVVYISLSIPLSIVSRIKPIAALKFD